ncbi:hypothetical protein [Streptomyces sp. 2231.1]|uniref:hypothetical protein n=1 Tax=Streptomyces sp. 2231.1 TaxID=1855347 RepID=UPI00115FCFFC|nr:hypothetical protein [Streptomyces sp. 2231.1]
MNEEETVRINHVQVGESYIACIPRRLPNAIRKRPALTLGEWEADVQMHLARGHRIMVAVTGYGDEHGTVTVTQEVVTSRVGVQLTDEQALHLGLAVGQVYDIDGTVRDGVGRIITFRKAVTHTLPVRWLRPVSERLELPPDMLQTYRAQVCRAADGMSCSEIRQATIGALETVHKLQGLALDNPNYDRSVSAAEVEHDEWRRIARHVEGNSLSAYDLRVDPDAIKDPPPVQFR